jgi:putative phosphotransacetylase
MDQNGLRRIIERVILLRLAKEGQFLVPVASSARHIHLCQGDVDRLFSPGYRLTKLRDLSQPGQFACEERVTLETAKGRMALRVLGPVRKSTQVEISAGDAIALGLPPALRMSGDISGSPGARLVNGDRYIEMQQGVIVAARHLHIAEDEARVYGLKNGDLVSLSVEGKRSIVFGNVAVRCGPGHVLEAHIDKDEANAAGLDDGALCSVLLPALPAAVQGDRRMFFGEEDIVAVYRAGSTRIEIEKRAVLTPLARDAASRYGIEICRKGR